MLDKRSIRLKTFLFIAIGLASVSTISACGRTAQQPGPFATPITVTPPTAHNTPVPSPRQHVHIPLTAAYKSFIKAICTAMHARNAHAISNQLEYTQANSGLYYSTFDKSEGTMSMDVIGTLTQWFTGANPSCFRFAPGQAGHGVVAVQGWNLDGGWALLDLDTINGGWKIDDFTFGRRGNVMHAFYSTVPEALKYPGKI